MEFRLTHPLVVTNGGVFGPNGEIKKRVTTESEGSTISVAEVVEELVRRAEACSASDIHLQMTGKRAQVAFRLDGVMVPASEFADDIAERVFGRIKFLAKLKTYQDSLPQDGRIDRSDLKSSNDLRVATYPTVTGEKIVLRLFQSSTAQSLAEIGFSEQTRAELENCLRQSTGLILLTGPAGSGKTTTIYACLRYLAELGGRHIITIEDPVEQVLSGIMQTEVNEARGLDFAMAARHLLRQDPQVLVIGEIRDEDTATLAVRAGLTGHLVISTLHAGCCRGVVDRLFTLCADRYAAVSSLELLLNQRLLRRVCAQCNGKGCQHCVQTGYRGRMPIVETVRINDELRSAIRERGPAAIAPSQTLRVVAQRLVEQGITNDAEINRVLGS